MAKGFERIGSPVEAEEVCITIEDAERVRSIGHEIMFLSTSSKHIDDSIIAASVVAPNNFNIPGFWDSSVPALYMYVEDESYGEDGWRSLLRYNSYRDCEGLLGFESDYEIEILGEEVVIAKRSIFRLRDTREITSIRNNEIDIQVVERRTMTETPLTSAHIDTLERRTKRLAARSQRGETYGI